MLVLTAACSHTGWLGPFDYWHRNKPRPFNPEYDARARDWGRTASASMEADHFYATHTRAECAAEWRRRYDAAKEAAHVAAN